MKRIVLTKDQRIVVTAIIVVLFVVGLWSMTLIFLRPIGEVKRGTFGDMFGAVNALFSGLAFSGIIFTILLQREELTLQRQELKETKEELKRSADAQERSEKALINQQNQSTYFNLLENQKKLLETIRLDDLLGFAGIREFATKVRKELTEFSTLQKKQHFPSFKDTLKHPYNAIKYNHSGISTYLKHLQILEHFLEKNLSEKLLFHDILYNYLSVPEKYLLGIIYYYGKRNDIEFLNKNYNYLFYYETELEKFLNKEDEYFPTLAVTQSGLANFYESSLDSAPKILETTIVLLRNFYEHHQLALKDVEFAVKNDKDEKPGNLVSIMSEVTWKLEENKLTISFTKFLRGKLAALDESGTYFHYLLSFSYNNNIYKIPYVHYVYKTMEAIHSDEDYSEEIHYYLNDFSQ